jgi:hypothetical protein
MTTPNIPIACDPRAFTQQERPRALELSLGVLRHWPTKIEKLSDGYLLHYQGDSQRLLQLAQFVANETRCCPWASFAIEFDAAPLSEPKTLRLRMTGSAEGKALLAQGFEYLAQNYTERDPGFDADSVEAFVQGWEERQRSA